MNAPIDGDLRNAFSTAARLQRYLDVEAALATAQDELGIIPAGAGAAIAAYAHVDRLDTGRIAREQEVTGHLMVPIVEELARAAGDAAGGWVHWGATTQNIQQTGDVLGIREALDRITAQVCELLIRLADLGLAGADVVTAGRTHRQHAVPITFGFKVAAWSDAFIRHLDRLAELRPRVLTCMTGGAAGTFAAMGPDGPAVQARVAALLELEPMAVPSRGIADQFAELVCVLGLISATGATLAEEVARLMGTDFGEVSEPVPPGDVGSSTMPQKRNAKLCGQAITTAAQLRILVPLALDAMIQSHEVDGARSAMMDRAVTDGCILTSDLLALLVRIVDGLEIFPDRMRANLDLTGGLISAEAVMMNLGLVIGRQEAHQVVRRAAKAVSAGGAHTSFADALLAEPSVTARLSRSEITALLDPTTHVGLSAQIARDASAHAVAAARRMSS